MSKDKIVDDKTSYRMSRVKSRDTSIERRLGKALWAAGFRYRKNYHGLKGSPDFVLVKHRIAIFCDSAFWHGYKNMTTKRHVFKSNVDFWTRKIKRNMLRDKEVKKFLKKSGWAVLRFWDFQIEKNLDKCVARVVEEIQKQESEKY